MTGTATVVRLWAIVPLVALALPSVVSVVTAFQTPAGGGSLLGSSTRTTGIGTTFITAGTPQTTTATALAFIQPNGQRRVSPLWTASSSSSSSSGDDGANNKQDVVAPSVSTGLSSSSPFKDGESVGGEGTSSLETTSTASADKDTTSQSSTSGGITKTILLAVPLFCKFVVVLMIKFLTDLVVFPVLFLWRMARLVKNKFLSTLFGTNKNNTNKNNNKLQPQQGINPDVQQPNGSSNGINDELINGDTGKH